MHICLLLLWLALPCRSFGRQSAFASRHETELGWVPLTEWARENDFKVIWTRKYELFSLTNGSSVLSFKTDSEQAIINGVMVWLCDPITPKNGQDCISSIDLNDLLKPILFPQTSQNRHTIETICLDPGHGGKDTGGMSGGYMEKRYTLPLADELARQLEVAGFKVILTRTNDTFVDLDDRPARACREKADLFISLHFNIGAPGEARGVEVYCLTPPKASSTNAGGEKSGLSLGSDAFPGNRYDNCNVFLGYELQKSLVDDLPANDRGLRRARFAVLRTAEMPAVLIEGGFLTDSAEQKKIADPKYRSRLARAVVCGVLDYKRIFDSQ